MSLTPGTFRFFVSEIVGAIDTGKYQQIGMKEIEEHIESGDLIPFLGKTLGEDVDLSIVEADDASAINAKYLDLWLGNLNRERKWGIRNSGLCLLVAWGLSILGSFDTWAKDA